MKRFRNRLSLPREKMVQVLALGCLLLMGAMVLVGPSGILAWSENRRLLEQRHAELVRLRAERDEIRNRVNLLDPRHADADLTGELLRSNLNVVHPDEMVMMIK